MNPFYKVIFTDGTYKEVMAPNGNAAKKKAEKMYKQTVKEVVREIPTSKNAIKDDDLSDIPTSSKEAAE